MELKNIFILFILLNIFIFCNCQAQQNSTETIIPQNDTQNITETENNEDNKINEDIKIENNNQNNNEIKIEESKDKQTDENINQINNE